MSAAALKKSKKSDPECHSFLPGTKVLLAGGGTKPIEKVKLGDKVVTTDAKTGRTTVREVAGTIVTEDDKSFSDLTVKTPAGKKQALIATTTHPFWVVSEGAWIKAGALEPGMKLRTASGTTVEITGNRHYEQRQRTHDLTVTGIHSYYVLAGATPVLVHNCDEGYADVYFDDVEGHASVSVTHGDTTMHTEAGSQPGSDSVPGVRARPHSSGTIVVRVPLPNARNAQRAQYAMEDVNLGPHDNNTNNCVTYCARILRAGGVDVPANESQNIAGWLLNSSHPQRRL
ncbi:polymorphic toxin-type HINT domain-containing protein [Streptomyces sp. NPDC088794]|uniref:polymorphic toxin-type HINT domain-containing protein n=1 Tax=Streptomyces sp. NPDC088794 TaxID=3365902 RepID=UPI00380B476A